MTATMSQPLSFAGSPPDSWAFGIRFRIAVVLMLTVGLSLGHNPSTTAALTVAIPRLPVRGEALLNACLRWLATFIGLAAAIATARRSRSGESPDPCCLFWESA